jgi:hypothetical protein
MFRQSLRGQPAGSSGGAAKLKEAEMRRNGLLILIAAVLISVGVYFFLHGETAVDDTLVSDAASGPAPAADVKP